MACLALRPQHLMNGYLVPGGHWGVPGSFMWSGQLWAICAHGLPCREKHLCVQAARSTQGELEEDKYQDPVYILDEIFVGFSTWRNPLQLRHPLMSPEGRSSCVWFDAHTRVIRLHCTLLLSSSEVLGDGHRFGHPVPLPRGSEMLSNLSKVAELASGWGGPQTQVSLILKLVLSCPWKGVLALDEDKAYSFLF